MKESPDLTVTEVFTAYLANLEMRVASKQYSAKTLAAVRFELHRFGVRFGKQKVSECRQYDLTLWLSTNPQFKSTHTKKRVIVSIMTAFRWAEEEELILHAPYKSPRILRGLPLNVRRPMTRDEYVKLMRHTSSRPMRRALFFLRRLGVRTCEMRNLRWEAVRLDGPTPYLELADHKTFHQTHKARRIGLDAATARFLGNLRRQARESTIRMIPEVVRKKFAAFLAKSTSDEWKMFQQCFVFTNCEGNQWDKAVFARHLRRTAKRIGIDDGTADRTSAYGLRHLYAVDAIEAGISTRKIADQMGHAKTTTIDSFYGSHTKHRLEHLNDVANEIVSKRKRDKTAKQAATVA